MGVVRWVQIVHRRSNELADSMESNRHSALLLYAPGFEASSRILAACTDVLCARGGSDCSSNSRTLKGLIALLDRELIHEYPFSFNPRLRLTLFVSAPFFLPLFDALNEIYYKV
jgi:hypothetical protein